MSKAPQSVTEVTRKFKGLEVVEEKRKVVGGDDSDDDWGAASKGSQSDSEEEEPSSGPWVAKRNAPGYLGSDERMIDSWGLEQIRKERDEMTKGQWREVGEFLLSIVGDALGEAGPTQGHNLITEILGEDETEEELGDGKHRIYMQLEMRLDSLAEELAEVTEERDKLRKRAKFLELVEEIYQGKEKTGEAGVAGAKLEKLSNFLADAIHCLRGRS